MQKNSDIINIKIPSSILEIEELNHLEKLILSVGYTFDKKLGFNSLTNIEMSEMLGVDTNSLGKHRKQLLKLGYERVEKNIYYLTDKIKKVSTLEKREILLLPQVYSIKKLSVGAKLLWAEYNSLEKGKAGYCIAKRSYLAGRLKCSKDSISNWHSKLNDFKLLSYTELKHGKNTKQRKVKTKKFGKGEKPTLETKEVKETKEATTLIEDFETSNHSKLKQLHKHIATAIEHTEEEIHWRKYMGEVNSVDLTDKVKMNDFIWDTDVAINSRNDDREKVFSSILSLIDTKLNKKKGVEELKNEINYYMQSE